MSTPEPGFSPKGALMEGKRGLIMGVANDHSIAYGIARALRDQGAELAFTYQGEALGKRVKPLAGKLGSNLVLPCDVEDLATLDAAFDAIREVWGRLDFLVHCIAFSEKAELKGKYADTSRANFVRTMLVSAFSFTEAAARAAPLMAEGGAMVTLTFGGSTRVMPNYNVMGVAKAALECTVRYLAQDLGRRKIRVNAISAGPIKTLAARGISGLGDMLRSHAERAPLQRNVEVGEVGSTGVFLASDASSGITGEVIYVDCGYNIMGF